MSLGVRDATLRTLEVVATALGDDSALVMFVGGAALALYEFNPSSEIRPSDDVDMVVEVRTLLDYYEFTDRLQSSRGFQPCTDEGAPACRYVVSGIRVDVLAAVQTPLTPANRWYAEALAHTHSSEAREHTLRVISPIYFIATKVEAYEGRGNGDMLASHDMEDIITVLDGIPATRSLIADGSTAVTTFVRAALVRYRNSDTFFDAIEGTCRNSSYEELTTWIRSLHG